MIVYIDRDIPTEGTRKNVDDLTTLVTLFYSHCLKWIYQPNRQGTSWINTIVGKSRDINKVLYDKKKKSLNRNILNSLNEDLYSIYKKGIIKAADETHLNIKKLDKDNIVFNSFDSVEKIIDLEFLKEWLIDNAYSDDIIRMVYIKYDEDYEY